MIKLEIILLFIFHGIIYGQTPEAEKVREEHRPVRHDHKHKNNIYGGATVWPIEGSLSLNYERLILDFPGRPGLAFYGGINFGKYVAWGSSGYRGTLTGNIIFLRKSHHIEAGLGKLLNIDMERKNRHPEDPNVKYTYMQSTINLGYRYQSPVSHLFFRAGLSYPEGLYSGLGLHF